MNVNDIRQTYLDYFSRQGHTIVPSAPLVPQNDPTLMFVNSGMVPFKNVFTGTETRPYSRATSAQKCVRAGGKHNDLENVGYTARHHTFFEMLGNFSFGDYFKEDAIAFAWELVTKVFGVDKERLLVTVYAEDQEAPLIWKRVAGLSDQKIIKIATTDNFWSMGPVGPCGPCTEIFYDHGPNIPGGPPGSPDEDGDRFVEIWNLVFMQFNQLESGERHPLPKPSIDTGMGLERMAAVLQGVTGNYETDLFQTLINATADLAHVTYEGQSKPSLRVIADHLRSGCFLLADGVMPSNEGRGYVLRRILRRAMRHAHTLGVKDPLLWKLVSTLTAEMGRAYPELSRAEPMIKETLRLEEERFRSTLDRGLKLLEEEVGKLSSSQSLSGEVAFKLYDTYGFPLDLTQDILRGEGRTLDLPGFEASMAKQKQEARAAWAGSGDSKVDQLWLDLQEKIGSTEFLGYQTESAEAVITAIVEAGKEVHHATKGSEIQLIVNQSPFYGESGGQMGDTGTIVGPGFTFDVHDTLKRGQGLIVHKGTLTQGTLNIGDAGKLTVNSKRRRQLRAHHSATHLLHKALREVLGDHVTQKGSLVSPDRLRFDFAHGKALSQDEVRAIEHKVNDLIRLNSPVKTEIMSQKSALDSGAMALFGEKYADDVRVVSMGEDSEAVSNKPYSVELCGGTHVKQTGDIGYFKIVSESALASGVRRIEALTGSSAEAFIESYEDILSSLSTLLKAPPHDFEKKITALIDERKRLEKTLRAGATPMGNQDIETHTVHTQQVAVLRLENTPAKDLKTIADTLKSKKLYGVIIVTSKDEGRGSIVVAVDSVHTSTLSAVDLVKIGAACIGGQGGGGRPEMAQSGGPDGDKIPEAITEILRELEGAFKP